MAPLLNRWRALLARVTAPLRYPLTGRSPVQRSTAGETVTPERALTIGTVWRCTNYISQAIASSRMSVRRRDDRDFLIPAPEDPVNRVLNGRANNELSVFSFMETITASELLRGNGYAEIERDLAGRPIALHYLTPDRVTVRRSLVETDPYFGDKFFEVSNSMGPTSYLPNRDVLHFYSLGYDGMVGLSVVAYAARTFGLSMAEEEFASAFYGNGAWSGGFLTKEGRVTQENRERLTEAFNEVHRGARRSFRVAVLGDGFGWTPGMIPQTDAQFIESRGFTGLDVCRWFGVPPSKIYDWSNNTYNNVWSANRDVVVDTLIPHMRRMADELKMKLLNMGSNGREVYFDLGHFAQADPETRSKYYEAMYGTGAMTANEIRRQEGMPPIPEGDRTFIQSNNVTPADRVDDVLDNQLAPPVSPPAPAAAPADDGDADEDAAANRAMARLQHEAALDLSTRALNASTVAEMDHFLQLLQEHRA